MTNLDKPGHSFTNGSFFEGERVYLHDGKFLKALNKASGIVIWSRELSLNPKQSSYVLCLSRSDDVYVCYGENSEYIRAIDKNSGALSWDYSGDSAVYCFLADGRNLYLSRRSAAESALIALNQSNGRLRWKRNLHEAFPSCDEDGQLYLQSGSTVSRLRAEDGKETWTYSSSGHFIAMESRRGGFLFLREDRLFSRINIASGKALWSRELPASSASLSAHMTVTKSARVFLQEADFARNCLTLKCIDLFSGQSRWEKTYQGEPPPYLIEDGSGRIFLVQGKQLIALNEESGEIKWIYLRSDENAESDMFCVEGRGKCLYPIFGAAGHEESRGSLSGRAKGRGKRRELPSRA